MSFSLTHFFLSNCSEALADGCLIADRFPLLLLRITRYERGSLANIGFFHTMALHTD
jgi:hypothetical protein